MSAKVSQAVARPARTAVQAVPSLVVTEFIDAFVYNLSDKQYAALAGLLLLVFGYLQVVVENKNGVGFMRRIIPGDVPVVSRVEDEAKDVVAVHNDQVTTLVTGTLETSVTSNLTGTYPNPTIAPGAVTPAKVSESTRIESSKPSHLPEHQAVDEGDENADLMVGDPVNPEHKIDVSSFHEIDEDEK